MVRVANQTQLMVLQMLYIATKINVTGKISETVTTSEILYELKVFGLGRIKFLKDYMCKPYIILDCLKFIGYERSRINV